MQAQLNDIHQEDIIPDGEEFYEDDAPQVSIASGHIHFVTALSGSIFKRKRRDAAAGL